MISSNFRVLIRVQELIFIRNQSRDSFILIKLNTLHSWKEYVRVYSNQWDNSINWSYLYDADVFIQFRVMIRVMIPVQELIFIRNQSRDSFILIEWSTLHSQKEYVRVNSVLWHNSLNLSYLHGADDLFHFRVLIRVQELISIRNQSRYSFIVIELNTLHSWKEYVRVNPVLWHNSLNWSYLHDADDFFHFRVLIRVQELIFIRNQSRDSFILIKLNTLHSWKEFVRVNLNQWDNSINWSYLYDADVFIQFRVMIRVMIRVQELISIRNQSRDSFLVIKFNTLHPWKKYVRVYSNQSYNSLNWSYLYDAEVFFQFQILIRVQELIFIRNQSRDSFILIELNTLHSWKEYVRVNSVLWHNSLNWSCLYDADVFFHFRVLIRVQELIFIRNQFRDSFI